MVDSQELKHRMSKLFNTHEYYIVMYGNRIKCSGTKYYAAILSRVLTVMY
jgi:hypothetical protein